MPYPGLLHPEPLPLRQATADLYLHRRHSNTVQAQSLWDHWVLVCTRFVWALWASLAGMGFDSKCDFAPSTIFLGLLLCPWTWGIIFLVGSNILLSMVVQQRIVILEFCRRRWVHILLLCHLDLGFPPTQSKQGNTWMNNTLSGSSNCCCNIQQGTAIIREGLMATWGNRGKLLGKWHLSRGLKGQRDGSKQRAGEETYRQREGQLQRPGGRN